MATIKRFEDLDVWQRSRTFNKKLAPLIENLYEKKNFSLSNQIERSAGSIMDNIAEGFERDGNREFIQFLAISKGSAGETRSQLYRALDRGFLNEKEFVELKEEAEVISNMIGRFMSYLTNSNIKGRKFNRPTENAITNAK